MKQADTVKVHDKVFKALITPEQIAVRVQELAADIDVAYAGKLPILIGVLKGSFLFLADLARNMKTESHISFLRVSSYHEGMTSNGAVRQDMHLAEDLNNRHVIIVEDVVDTGNTAVFLLEEVKKQNPASVKLVTLLFKPSALKHDFKPDYTAFEIGNEFVVGYGLDYNQGGRNLPGIYVVDGQE